MVTIAGQLLIPLVTGHSIAEFLLHPHGEGRGRPTLRHLIIHSAIVTFLSYVLCGLWRIWEIPAAIFLSHALIDFTAAGGEGKEILVFSGNQMAHGMVLMGISIIVPVTRHGMVAPFWEKLGGAMYYKLLILLSGAIITVQAGSTIIDLAVMPFLEQLKQARNEIGLSQAQPIHIMSRGFENGGRIIGQLERALIFLFVLVNQPSAIGFLITAKSVFRFGELKDRENRMEAEYIIIGTLMSFFFAIASAYITKYLFELL